MQGALEMPNLVELTLPKGLNKISDYKLKKEPCDSGSCYMMPKVKMLTVIYVYIYSYTWYE